MSSFLYMIYDDYAKRHGMLMKTLLVLNALFYANEGMTQTQIIDNADIFGVLCLFEYRFFEWSYLKIKGENKNA